MYNLKDSKVLYRDNIPSSTTDLYTVPANQIIMVTLISFVNADNTNSTNVNLWVNTASNIYLLSKITNLRPSRGRQQNRQLILQAGDIIKGSSTNAACTCIINGVILEKV